MKNNYFLTLILSVFFFGNIFTFASCPIDFKPVCGQKQWVCVNGNCWKLLRTYSNKCFLEQDGAVFVKDGSCSSNLKKVNKVEKVTEKQEIISQKNTWQVVLTEQIQQEIEDIVNSIILRLDGKSDKAKEVYILDFVGQLDKLTAKLKSPIQIKKYQIVRTRLMDIIKKEGNGVQEGESGEKEEKEGKEELEMKPYNFSSLWIQIVAPSDWKFQVNWEQMYFTKWKQQFIVNLLQKSSIQDQQVMPEDNPKEQNIEPKQENETISEIQELDAYEKVLMKWEDKNNIISKYIRDSICTQTNWWKRLASYQIIKKDKPYSNVAEYEMLYLCQEYSKKLGKWSGKTTGSSPLKISLLRKDWLYHLVKVQKPSNWSSYSQDIKKIFSLQNQKLLLWEDIDAYNKIIDSLLEQNSSWASENLQ